jgi:hypothetical protein
MGIGSEESRFIAKLSPNVIEKTLLRDESAAGQHGKCGNEFAKGSGMLDDVFLCSERRAPWTYARPI